MNIKITLDDGTEREYRDILDYFLVYRSQVILQTTKDKKIGFEIQTKSESHATSNFREVIKETRQALTEVEDECRQRRNNSVG